MNAHRDDRYKLQASILAALGHPVRLAIADLLRHGERCVCDIAAQVAAERSNVSRHLAMMRSAGVVSTRREGLLVYYRLRTPCLMNLMDCATQVLRENTDATCRALETPRAPRAPQAPPRRRQTARR